jgi:hypothetical protein
VPTAQVVQPAAPTVPLPVTVPAVPGAQIVHAETLALPAAEPVVKMFAGQAVQPVALSKPLSVTVP